MSKDEIRNIVDKFKDTYLTREDIINYIYDASHALAEIKNGLRGEHE